jgi:hypothetical protein
MQRDPVIPAFPDLHLAPASMLKELAPYFHRLSAQMRFIGLPLPHELSPKEASEYPTAPILSKLFVFYLFAMLTISSFFESFSSELKIHESL